MGDNNKIYSVPSDLKIAVNRRVPWIVVLCMSGNGKASKSWHDKSGNRWGRMLKDPATCMQWKEDGRSYGSMVQLV